MWLQITDAVNVSVSVDVSPDELVSDPNDCKPASHKKPANYKSS